MTIPNLEVPGIFGMLDAIGLNVGHFKVRAMVVLGRSILANRLDDNLCFSAMREPDFTFVEGWASSFVKFACAVHDGVYYGRFEGFVKLFRTVYEEANNLL